MKPKWFFKTSHNQLYTHPQTHCWDDGVPLEETLRTLDDLVRVGKIRYVGVSNVTGWQLQKLVDTTQRLGLNPIISLQVRLFMYVCVRVSVCVCICGFF